MITIPHDKALHFAAGTIAATIGVLVLPWLPAAALASLSPAHHAAIAAAAAALLREAYNVWRAGRFDLKDVAATLAGGAMVVVPVAGVPV